MGAPTGPSRPDQHHHHPLLPAASLLDDCLARATRHRVVERVLSRPHRPWVGHRPDLRRGVRTGLRKALPDRPPRALRHQEHRSPALSPFPAAASHQREAPGQQPLAAAPARDEHGRRHRSRSARHQRRQRVCIRFPSGRSVPQRLPSHLCRQCAPAIAGGPLPPLPAVYLPARYCQFEREVRTLRVPRSMRRVAGPGLRPDRRHLCRGTLLRLAAQSRHAGPGSRAHAESLVNFLPPTAKGKAGPFLLTLGRALYQACFIACANFAAGRVFSTSSLVSHARRACRIPYLILSRCEVWCESVLITIFTPSCLAWRKCTSFRSSRSGYEFSSIATLCFAAAFSTASISRAYSSRLNS